MRNAKHNNGQCECTFAEARPKRKLSLDSLLSSILSILGLKLEDSLACMTI